MHYQYKNYQHYSSEFLSTAAVVPELTNVIQKSIIPSCKTPSPVHILHRSLAMQMTEYKHKGEVRTRCVIKTNDPTNYKQENRNIRRF